MQAIETTGRVDEQGRLHLDQPLVAPHHGRVRVIVLFAPDAEVDERAWLQAATCNPAFDFLKDPEEDLYTADEGQPFVLARENDDEG